MSALERTLRFMALPIAVFLATIAMWWVWATYPNDEHFFLTRILPFYSLYLVLTAVCMKVLSGQIWQFMMIVTLVSALFMVEIFLRTFMGVLLF